MIFIARFCARLVGLDLFAPNYRCGPLTMFIFVLTTLGAPTVIYSMLTRDRVIVMRACTLLGVMFQAWLKALLFYNKRKQIVNVYYYLRSLYKRNARATNGNAEILLRWVTRFSLMQRAAIVVLSSAMFTFLAHPLIASGTLLSERDTVLPLYYPLVDETTRFGQCVLLVIHLTYLLMGLMGILAADLCFWILMMHICPMADMWINLLQRLDADSQRVNREGNDDQKVLNYCLNNIVEIQNEIFG